MKLRLKNTVLLAMQFNCVKCESLMFAMRTFSLSNFCFMYEGSSGSLGSVAHFKLDIEKRDFYFHGSVNYNFKLT